MKVPFLRHKFQENWCEKLRNLGVKPSFPEICSPNRNLHARFLINFLIRPLEIIDCMFCINARIGYSLFHSCIGF